MQPVIEPAVPFGIIVYERMGSGLGTLENPIRDCYSSVWKHQETIEKNCV